MDTSRHNFFTDTIFLEQRDQNAVKRNPPYVLPPGLGPLDQASRSEAEAAVVLWAWNDRQLFSGRTHFTFP